LLKEHDESPKLRQEILQAMRTTQQHLTEEFNRVLDEELQRLNANNVWETLPRERIESLLMEYGLAFVPTLAFATEAEVLEAMETTTVAMWHARIAAVSEAVDAVLEVACQERFTTGRDASKGQAEGASSPSPDLALLFKVPVPNRSEKDMATFLLTKGEQLNDEIRRQFEELKDGITSANLFDAAIAYSLIWAERAKLSEKFMVAAVDYLSSGTPGALSACEPHSKHRNPTQLTTALCSWHDLKAQLPPLTTDLETCKAIELCQLQKLYLAEQAQHKYSGIGAWLFCAPFKTLALMRVDLWCVPDLDELLMPLGGPVVRGTKHLLRKGYDFGTDLKSFELPDVDRKFDSGMLALRKVQDYTDKIATLGQDRILHANSGLHLVGKGTLSV
jgi:hypothetical protein